MKKHHRTSTSHTSLLPLPVENKIRELLTKWITPKDPADPLAQDTPLRKYVIKKLSQTHDASEVLRGVVAAVDVGSEPRALPLRAALTALGATVVPTWSPIATHLIWSEGGDRKARAAARAAASHVVSPLWVEACATAARRLPERSFPPAPRPSDLPSPATLLKQLKKAERNNLPILDVSNDTVRKESRKSKPGTAARDDGTSDSEEETADESEDRSADTTRDTETSPERSSQSRTAHRRPIRYTDSEEDDESRVNKRPRRALPKSVSSPGEGLPWFAPGSQRPASSQVGASSALVLSHRDKTALARAERTARKEAASEFRAVTTRTPKGGGRSAARGGKARTGDTGSPRLLASQDTIYSRDGQIRIVLTGLHLAERRRLFHLLKRMGARVQRRVTFRTTHVVVGCRGLNDTGGARGQCVRTLNALLGAARGCRVVTAQWALDCSRERRWLACRPYTVPFLRRAAEKAFSERHAFGLMNSEYAFNVFGGQRVQLSLQADDRAAALQLLSLCGAVVINEDGQVIATGNTGLEQQPDDLSESCRPRNCLIRAKPPTAIVVGTLPGQVSSKWVFDSVNHGRAHQLRNYINNESNPNTFS